MVGTDTHCPHEKGVPPHQPMDFAEWYDVVEVSFRDEW
jgi:hypothetical protein